VPARLAAPSEAQVREYLTTLSNWGRWGSDDELGTINLITPAKRQAAARLVTHGESVTCARPIRTEIAADTTFQPLRFMVDSGEGRDAVSPERALERRGASEFIGMVFHGYSITHVDAPSHYFWEGQLYNGRSCNAVTSREGATVCSVEGLRDGVVSRGVLLDVALTRGVRWLEAGEGVMPEDLDAAERAAGVRVESGDILLVRTGYYGRRLAEGPVHPLRAGNPALHAACCPWLRERGVAMIGTDTHNDVTPLPYPSMGNAFHVVCSGSSTTRISRTWRRPRPGSTGGNSS
jgi:kynurenine formamidase